MLPHAPARSLRPTPRPTPRGPLSATVLLASIVLAVSACGPDGASRTTSGTGTTLGVVEELASPAPPGSKTPFIIADDQGAAYLSWTEQRADSSFAIRLAKWNGTVWDSARTITADRPYFVNWADFPAIVRLDNGDLAAHWLEREGTGSYAYGVRVVRSSDQGRSWSAPVTPHTDGLLAEHGFVSLWAEGAGDVGVAWLDGRKSAMPDSTREMTVRTAVVRADGQLTREAVLDPRTCDCCQTATARGSQGRVIVYRDRSDKDIRDIAIVREVAGGWSPPVLVHADDWYYPGCPVNGPQVAASGTTVVVAWYTAAHDTARVLLARSTDGGATFGAPVRIDEGHPIGRVAVVLDGQAEPVVAWLEQRSPEEAEVLVRRVIGTTLSATRSLAKTSGARQSGFPRLAVQHDTLLATWTTPKPASQVHVARLSLSVSAR